MDMFVFGAQGLVAVWAVTSVCVDSLINIIIMLLCVIEISKSVAATCVAETN